MIIKKLHSSSCLQLFNDLKDNFSKTSKLYTDADLDLPSKLNNLKKIEGGFFELDESLFRTNDQLKLNTDGKGTFDFENARIIYNSFKELTPSDANDKRLWIRLTHDHGYKYTIDRWMRKYSSKDVIKERFFFEGSAQSARVRNSIARLWWIAHLTIDKQADTEEDKWRYTKAICTSQDFITSILERTMGTYQNVRLGILEAYIQNPEVFGTTLSKNIQKVTREINNFGGVSLLSMLSKDEVKNKVVQMLK